MLERKVFMEISVLDGAFLIRINDLLTVIELIARCGIHNPLYFILDVYKQTVPIRFSFDKFNRMTDQLSEVVVVREFSLIVGDFSDKRCVLSNMPADINGNAIV